MKKTAYLLAVLFVVIAAPSFGQAFTDVPADHWAYDAANQLQKDGILIGYPDGTFQGKRTITRYEFATAIARLADWANGQFELKGTKPPVGGTWATQADIDAAIAKIEKLDMSKYATKDDVAALRKLIDEFRDEIAALGVDVDALKRDVAALGARVDAIEAELKRVRFTGDVNVFAIATAVTSTVPLVDLDQRTTSNPNDSMLRNISMVKDFDLKVAGRVSQNVSANAVINYGNYLNYLGFLDDYVGGGRPINTSSRAPGIASGNPNADSLADTFFPTLLSIDAALGKGSFTVGRFPLQFTPYTLKKIDVDSYTSILKTDDGNYPVDGVKVGYNFGGVDLTLFAAKSDTNIYLANGLTAQPTAPGFSGSVNSGVLHQLATGHAVGGLTFADQTAGARVTAGVPGNGIIGVTYYQSWDQGQYNLASVGALTYDSARVFGADLAIPIPWVETMAFAGSWTRSDTLVAAPASNNPAVDDIDYKNTAWDAKFTGNVATLAIGAGYKSIGRNFAAAGAWDKIGRWTNPTDVKGPYAEFAYPVMDNLKLTLNGEMLTCADQFNAGGLWGTTTDDDVIKAEGALKWGFTKCSAVDLAYQWVKWSPDTGGVTSATENYITFGLSHQVSPNAGVRLGYQFISYTNSGTGIAGGPYGGDYRGGLGVVQMGVSF